MHNLVRRGSTFFARVTIPKDRWSDVGRALAVPSGIVRERVRTLQTRDHREAVQRRDKAVAAIRAEIDAALEQHGLKPLTDWTASWEVRAIERRRELQDRGAEVVAWEDDPKGSGQAKPWLFRDEIKDTLREEEQEVARRVGHRAAQAYSAVVLGDGMSIAEASRLWLDGEQGRVREQTLAGHKAALKLLGSYMANHEGRGTLEAVTLDDVTRRIAGEFIAARRATKAAATVQREFSTYSGLWRWACRRDYAKANPWADQTTGLKSAKGAVDEDDEGKRGYTSAELVTLLNAGADKLAPNGGGYGPALWDVIRLGLLTGCRADELLRLRCQDVIEAGTALVIAGTRRGGKTDAASRIMPLHALAQPVIAARMAALPDTSPTAPLWSEVPASGGDGRRSKTLVTRFVVARRRVLGNSDEVDLHSLRRTFMTACETAMHNGGRINAELIALLVGHDRGALSLDLYSDWSRMGRKEFRGGLGKRLETLRAAVDDAVVLGLGKDVVEALRTTAGSRPEVVRTAPAFSRKAMPSLSD